MGINKLSKERLEEVANSIGLVYVAALPLELYSENRTIHFERLRNWQNSGYAADMTYMQRDPELFLNLENFLQGYRSVVQFLVPYATPGERELQDCPQGFGRIARYAWGRDYHKIIPKLLRRLVNDLIKDSAIDSETSYRIFTDAVPLLERAMAADSGLGFIGKNSMLIRSGFGSYGFLAEVLWDVELEETPQERDLVKGGCGSCTRCITACPTNAFVAEKILDSNRCISYLSIEKRGAFNNWERQALGDWLFGCDICQEVCPFNHDFENSKSLAEFSKLQGAGSCIELNEIFKLRSDDSFNKKFSHTAITRTKREGLIRNAAAVAANTKSLQCVDSMIECFLAEKSPLIQGEIRSSLNRLEKYADGRIRRRIRNTIEQ